MDFARSENPTHLLTLNFHDRYTPEDAEKRVERWYIQVMHRLFRKPRVELNKQINFVAFPEYTKSWHIHYHAAVRIPMDYVGAFTRVGAASWKRIVPSSTFDLREIGGTADDLTDTLLYITKSSSSERVIHSSMFTPRVQ